MKFADIRKKEGKISGLVALERALPSRARAKTKKYLIIVAPLFMLVLLFLQNQNMLSVTVLYALILLVVAAWLVIFMLDCFYYSHYFQGAYYLLPEWGLDHTSEHVPYEVLEIAALTQAGDLAAGFMQSRAGVDIFARLDISQIDIQNFLNKPERQKTYTESAVFAEPISLVNYAAGVFDCDKSFAEFLSQHGLTREDFLETAAWIAAVYERRKEMYRWWGRDSLGRIRGVGKGWSKTETYLLEEYGVFAKPEDGEDLFKVEIDALERSLANAPGGNILFIADQHSKLKAVVSGLANRMYEGSILPQLAHKRLLVLKTELLDSSAAGMDSEFERLIIRLFNQAVGAGNLILIIDNLPTFLEAAKKRNLDIFELLQPYLASQDLDIVAFSSKNAYIQLVETNPRLKNWFQLLLIERDDRAIIIRALQRRAFGLERLHDIFFTHGALAAIAAQANRNLPADVIESRARQLFDELAPKLLRAKVKKVTEKEIKNIAGASTAKTMPAPIELANSGQVK